MTRNSPAVWQAYKAVKAANCVFCWSEYIGSGWRSGESGIAVTTYGLIAVPQGWRIKVQKGFSAHLERRIGVRLHNCSDLEGRPEVRSCPAAEHRFSIEQTETDR